MIVGTPLDIPGQAPEAVEVLKGGIEQIVFRMDHSPLRRIPMHHNLNSTIPIITIAEEVVIVIAAAAITTIIITIITVVTIVARQVPLEMLAALPVPAPPPLVLAKRT